MSKRNIEQQSSSNKKQRSYTPFLLATRSTNPQVFSQCKDTLIEPLDVESVPSAARLLSKNLKGQLQLQNVGNDQFMVRYRPTNAHEDNIFCEQTQKDLLCPVLNLSYLKEIKIDDKGELIKVDAGVTVGMLIKKLSAPNTLGLKELFMLAAPGDTKLSIVQTVLDKRFEKLRNAIKEVHVVDKYFNIESRKLSAVEQEDIMTNVVLSLTRDNANIEAKAINPMENVEEENEEEKDKKAEKDKIIQRWYSWNIIEAPFPDNFVSKLNIPDGVTVRIHKHGRLNNTPNVVIMVDGNEDFEAFRTDEWNKVLVRSPSQLWDLQHDLYLKAGLDVLNTSRLLVGAKYDSLDDIFKMFKNRRENFLITLEKGKIRASFDARYEPFLRLDDTVWFDEKESSVKAPRALMRKRASSMMTASGKGSTMPKSPEIIKRTVIPEFEGEVYDGQHNQMEEKRFQYATSSFDNVMNPSLIVYPEDEKDIVAAIAYATLDEFKDKRTTHVRPSGNPFKVMGRSGGHQYCGVSCDNGALIISMDKFNKLELQLLKVQKTVKGPDGNNHEVKKEVHVGVGVKLKELAEFMNKNGVTIPHGECPGVGMGGHAQSGGYGHIARNFGLAIDYVYGFTIVTANREIRTVNRDSEEKADKDLYWAVLGGSPGAFGITTNLIIHPILDEDYPNSTGYSSRIKSFPNSKTTYNFSPLFGLKRVLELLEEFINKSQVLDEGLDLCVSISIQNDNASSNSLMNTFNVIAVEMVCKEGKYENKTDPEMEYEKKADTEAGKEMKRIMAELEKLKNEGHDIGDPYDGKKHYTLSEMSKGYTRHFPSVTSDGRENRRAYRKAAYGSKDKLGSKGKWEPGWSAALAELLNDVKASTSDVSCIVQVVVGGGALSRFADANLNSIAHRNAHLQTIIFDLFRGEGNDSLKAAEAFQRRFEFDIVNKYQTKYPKIVPQWACHGDLDMNKKEVWEKYFDNPVTYHRLRYIKKTVDPNDVFHSRFTIRPADSSTVVLESLQYPGSYLDAGGDRKVHTAEKDALNKYRKWNLIYLGNDVVALESLQYLGSYLDAGGDRKVWTAEKDYSHNNYRKWKLIHLDNNVVALESLQHPGSYLDAGGDRKVWTTEKDYSHDNFRKWKLIYLE